MLSVFSLSNYRSFVFSSFSWMRMENKLSAIGLCQKQVAVIVVSCFFFSYSALCFILTLFSLFENGKSNNGSIISTAKPLKSTIDHCFCSQFVVSLNVFVNEWIWKKKENPWNGGNIWRMEIFKDFTLVFRCSFVLTFSFCISFLFLFST